MNTKLLTYFGGVLCGMFCLVSLAAVLPQPDPFGYVPRANAQEAPAPPKTNRKADLNKMGLLSFGTSTSIDALGIKIMNFLGKSIIYLSIIGIMSGGLMMVFAGGDEGRANRGKEIVIASIIGLIVTFSSYLIIKFVQLFIYGV